MAKDVGYRFAHLLGAICPERDVGADPVFAYVSTKDMRLLLAETAAPLPTSAPTAVLSDNAGFAYRQRARRAIHHQARKPTAPCTQVERHRACLGSTCATAIYQGRLFRHMGVFINACCDARNTHTAKAGRIRSLANYQWVQPITPLVRRI
jgi:hypothetical protein